MHRRSCGAVEHEAGFLDVFNFFMYAWTGLSSKGLLRLFLVESRFLSHYRYWCLFLNVNKMHVHTFFKAYTVQKDSFILFAFEVLR